MRLSATSLVLLPSLCLAVGGQLGASAPASARTIALLVVQNPAGDGPAARAVTEALLEELPRHGELADAAATRNALRRLRIRNGDAAPPDVLRLLAEELAVDWLISATVHDAERRDVPRLTLSARAYDGASGKLFWAGFKGGSGLDTRKLLGLGVIPEVERLAPRVVANLVSKLGEAGATSTSMSSGTVAIVDFDSLTQRASGAAADTVTEAARAAVLGRGLDLASPNCTSNALRRIRSTRRGAVDAEMRHAITSSCGAKTILTGTVELYDIGGAEMEPEPLVAISIRLLDAQTGRILWTGALEREGWNRSVFRIGRVYSRGALVERMLETMTRRLLERENTG